MAVYQAVVLVQVDESNKEVNLSKYLETAVTLNLDTEECGDAGVQAIQIDWSTLKLVKKNKKK